MRASRALRIARRPPLENAPDVPGWLQRWIRDESFWRDVTARTISGLIVLLLAALSAGMAAWAVSDGIRPSLASGGAAIGTLLIGMSVIFVWTRFMLRVITRAGYVNLGLSLIWFLLLVLGAFAFGAAAVYFGQGLADWAYTSNGGVISPK